MFLFPSSNFNLRQIQVPLLADFRRKPPDNPRDTPTSHPKRCLLYEILYKVPVSQLLSQSRKFMKFLTVCPSVDDSIADPLIVRSLQGMNITRKRDIFQLPRLRITISLELRILSSSCCILERSNNNHIQILQLTTATQKTMASARQAISPSNNKSDPEGSTARSSWNCVTDVDDWSFQLPPLPPALVDASRHRRDRSSDSVSFAPTDELFLIDYPDDIHRARESYTAEDEVLFKKEARADVIAFHRLKRDSSAPHSRHQDMCLVGIEQYILPADPNQRAKAKESAICAVLTEQDRLGRGGLADNNKSSARIAQVARECSKESASLAKIIGDFQYMQSVEDE